MLSRYGMPSWDPNGQGASPSHLDVLQPSLFDHLARTLAFCSSHSAVNLVVAIAQLGGHVNDLGGVGGDVSPHH